MSILKKYYYLIFAFATLIISDIQIRQFVVPGVFNEIYVGVVGVLFTAFWAFVILFLCVAVLPKKIGMITYIVVASVFEVLSFCQYIYYKIFNQFFWIKSVTVATEGTDYLGYAIEHMDFKLVVFVGMWLICVIVSLIKWERLLITANKKTAILALPVLGILLTHLYMQPFFHNDSTTQWDSWRKPSVVYKRFNDINKGIELAGLYQFTVSDVYKTVFAKDLDNEDDFLMVDEYFYNKGEQKDNSYTGIFKNKNVIAVMMESIDTWMVDEKYTPTICKMIKEGINFSNYNAPLFGAGFTFNSEFAFNTGFFTPLTAVSATGFSKHQYPYSLANLFKNEGYSVNSFHFNSSEFYNRGIMHKGFGYEKYYSLGDFGVLEPESHLDRNIALCDELYSKMTEKTPFFNFIITYSAHLPYNKDEGKLGIIKESYPELIDKNISEEKNNALILAKETDEFLRILLERLEEDGLIEDTVIVAYTDHFAYGVSDEKFMLENWKSDSLKYRVPAFIYNPKIKAETVDKPMMTIDMLPTLVNLFGLEKGGKYIGNDIFDPENPGFVYFENYSWLSEDMYYDPSENKGIDLENSEYIDKQNKRVIENMKINDIMVFGDYYKREKK